MPINRNIFAAYNAGIIDGHHHSKPGRLYLISKMKSVLTIIGLTILVICFLGWLAFFRDESFVASVRTVLFGGSQ